MSDLDFRLGFSLPKRVYSRVTRAEILISNPMAKISIVGKQTFFFPRSISEM